MTNKQLVNTLTMIIGLLLVAATLTSAYFAVTSAAQAKWHRAVFFLLCARFVGGLMVRKKDRLAEALRERNEMDRERMRKQAD
jgi:hypothetical protein